MCWRRRLLGHAVVENIPTEDFGRLVEELVAEGWGVRRRYEGLDAGIDVDRLVLQSGAIRLWLEWDNWDEGVLEGPRSIVQRIVADHGLPPISEDGGNRVS